MFKKSLLAVSTLLALGALTASAAHAADFGDAGLHCQPPVLQTPSDSETTMYSVDCTGPEHASISPSLHFEGEMPAVATPPYHLKPSYLIDIRSDADRETDGETREDQLVTGQIDTSVVSLAMLPTELAMRTHWDAQSGTLSVEETAGRWHAFGLRIEDDGETSEQSLTDAGYSSAPVVDGRSKVTMVFDKAYSRFAGHGNATPVTQADLSLRDGKLEVLVGDSRADNEQGLQGALLELDRKPQDITRAWALASRARFLGLDDEVRYAEQKVAAHSPQLLQEFQRDVNRIEPYSVERPSAHQE
jgi:hypothetical protein